MDSWAKTLSLGLFALLFVSFVISSANGAANWNTRRVGNGITGGSLAIDSHGNPHLVDYNWSFGDDGISYDMDYAVLMGTNWTTQIVDPLGGGGILALDSNNQPHIIYEVGNDLKYAVLSGENWSIQTIDSSSSRSYSMALDSNNNPHVVYSISHYNYSTNKLTSDIRYAVFEGSKWNIQTIDSVNVTVGNTLPKIALDSNNNPYIIYLETVQYRYYNKNSSNNPSLRENYNVKYAYAKDSIWSVQTMLSNCSGISNLVLDSIGKPSFSYLHENFAYLPDYGTLSTNYSVNYAYWNGYTWLTRTIAQQFIDSELGDTYLSLDSKGVPQVFFYEKMYQERTLSGLMFAQWTGSSWNIQNLGDIPSQPNYYVDTASITDFVVDGHGNLDLLYVGEVGTIHGAGIQGGLTYANLKISSYGLFSSEIILAFAVIGVFVILISLLLYKKHRATANSNESRKFDYIT